jgi:hypothetical protein
MIHIDISGVNSSLLLWEYGEWMHWSCTIPEHGLRPRRRSPSRAADQQLELRLAMVLPVVADILEVRGIETILNFHALPRKMQSRSKLGPKTCATQFWARRQALSGQFPC